MLQRSNQAARRTEGMWNIQILTSESDFRFRRLIQTSDSDGEAASDV